ncbi:MAG: tetratricopeptide repeat protein, partial [Planctomycetaceae bacterium]|nr:tetratricopeptide repeat protein [Planctomycetaceae bacterium]
FLPVGVLALFNRLAESTPLIKKVISGIVILPGIALLCSQSITDYNMIDANLQLLSQGEQFYQTELPSSHYSDFVKAGHWIKENSPENARLLTRRNDVATSGHRFQKLVYFEQTSPDRLHELIQTFSPRYLVCFDKNTAGAFPWHLLDNDLVYRLTPVYTKSGVTIIEVKPNNEGTIRHQYWQKDEAMNLATQALEKFPNRLSAQVAYLSQLLEAEKYQEVIDFVQQLPEDSDVRIVNFLGWAYLGQHQYEQALQAFSKALRMPGQSSVAQSIRRGGALAQQQLPQNKAATTPEKSDAPDRNLLIAKEFWKQANFDQVHKYAQKVLDSDKASQAELNQAHILMARLHFITGQTPQAVEALKQVTTTEHAEVKKLRDRIQLEESLGDMFDFNPQQKTEITEELDPKHQTAILKLVSIYESEGIPGKALKLLEQAHLRTPSDQQILKLLAKFQLFYNLIPEAETSYRLLQEKNPDDPEIAAALEKIEELKKTPRF